jgi:co-chaperonin GroES (HSP10)
VVVLADQRRSAVKFVGHHIGIERMDKNNKRLIVVGDRVLIHVQEGEERTKVGLYLPPTALDSQAVQGGKIVATGPGLPMPDPGESGDEPWRTPLRETRFVPMQARAGDYALFFRKAAVEITFEGDTYLVIPQSAILALVRDSDVED